jgi:hypothetical protein
MLSQGIKSIASSSEQLVGVCLVSHVPDDFVFGGIKNIEEGNGQFNNAQAGSKVASRSGHRFDNDLTDFPGQFGQFRPRELFQILRRIDLAEKFHFTVFPFYFCLSTT